MEYLQNLEVPPVKAKIAWTSLTQEIKTLFKATEIEEMGQNSV